MAVLWSGVGAAVLNAVEIVVVAELELTPKAVSRKNDAELHIFDGTGFIFT